MAQEDDDILQARRDKAKADREAKRANEQQALAERRTRAAALEAEHNANPPAQPSPVVHVQLYLWKLQGSVQTEAKHVVAPTVEEAMSHWQRKLAAKDEMLTDVSWSVRIDGIA